MEPVLLIGLKLPQDKAWQVDDYLDELKMLAENVGLDGRFRLVQKRNKPNPALFVGSGMVEKIHQLVVNESLTAVIFDDELSPAQQRNLEKILPVPVYDRTFIILTIFSERAKTKEARTQVELAQLKYEYPRLKKMWSHLHRQMGGIGGRGGEGEKQLEVDRRIARQKMERLETRLDRFEVGRNQRKKQRRNIQNVSLVGYTNAGKSTLMNQLTKANVEADDRVFVTLDATSRLWSIDPVLKVVLSDTVGFIRKLPHDLVASFRSTLSEVRDSDLLCHVIDASHPHLLELMETVDEVIKSIVANDVPHLMVFNKIDLVGDLERKTLKRAYPHGIFVSAVDKQGLDELRETIVEFFSYRIQIDDYLLPTDQSACFYRISDYGQVVHTYHDAEGVHIRIRGLKERLSALGREMPQLMTDSQAQHDLASAHEY
ncbi:MAG: GTPase HflX [Acidobacteria bacterium]|nr:GTPase HflX [Acidobacteriota bacterium]